MWPAAVPISDAPSVGQQGEDDAGVGGVKPHRARAVSGVPNRQANSRQ
jgi:hypothetical protein